MSRINRKVAFAAVILSLGFAAAGAAPALADVGPTQISPRATVHRHVAYPFGRPDYAGPAPSSSLQFAAGRGINAASCDLPSSGCSDNERITN
jgi:hypothetical protein